MVDFRMFVFMVFRCELKLRFLSKVMPSILRDWTIGMGEFGTVIMENELIRALDLGTEISRPSRRSSAAFNRSETQACNRKGISSGLDENCSVRSSAYAVTLWPSVMSSSIRGSRA